MVNVNIYQTFTINKSPELIGEKQFAFLSSKGPKLHSNTRTGFSCSGELSIQNYITLGPGPEII